MSVINVGSNCVTAIYKANITDEYVPTKICAAAKEISELGLGILQHDNNIFHGPWIAGGCLRSIIENKPRSDLDCYFSNYSDYLKTHNIILARPSLQAKLLYRDEMVSSYETSIGKIDLVTRFHQDPPSCLLDFDFTCCQLAVDLNKNVYWGEHTLEHIKDRKLVISNPKNPFGTMLRLQKYAVKGYSISIEEAEKLANAIKNCDWQQIANRLKKRSVY